MGFPDIGAIDIRYAGVVELNLGDQWRARWIPESELPEGAPVIRAHALVFAGDKGYVVRKRGEGRWETLEGEIDPAEGPAAFLNRAARERMGIAIGRLELVGFLLCKATRHNQDHALGASAVMAVYMAVAEEVGEVPAESGYERRRLPLNEFGAAVRTRYPDIEGYLSNATQRYAVLRAKGQV